MWLEMSRDEEHGGSGWSFTECLWSPSHKNPSGKWIFWELLLRIKKGDVIVHLRGKTHHAAFVGYSIADAGGYETVERPTTPKHWGYATSYYRVPLTEFVPFGDPINLDEVFSQQDSLLSKFYESNKEKPRGEKEHIFFIIQTNQLRCLNGAYISELSLELANIILGPDFSGASTETRSSAISVRTGQQISSIKTRIGQNSFSDSVRESYNHRCCFPQCPIAEREFLVGAHIARWSDAPSLRGKTSNGLCLCLFHDKAFELGLFTLSANYRI